MYVFHTNRIGFTINASQSNFLFLLHVNVTRYFYLFISNSNLTLVFHARMVAIKTANQWLVHTVRIALMCDDISLTKITNKPCFDNAKCKFYHKPIPKAVKMKRIPTWKQHESNKSLSKCCPNEAWWWILSMWHNRAQDL